ncbi:hypothetical protein SAMN04490247_1170 [Salimicrobium halophilum]|uniref:Uncharacterized protein n=1 Tax=Salimicrobium halophilum TaxID=86666 RepID=A0A1G8RZ79_9BACI|nr:hypothetical protein SAMN04490247_1170 [Salimicrobium halophilum]
MISVTNKKVGRLFIYSKAFHKDVERKFKEELLK